MSGSNHRDGHDHDEAVQDRVRDGESEVQLLRGYAMSLLGFGAGPVVRRGPSADEEEAKEESDAPSRDQGKHGGGGPVVPGC